MMKQMTFAAIALLSAVSAVTTVKDSKTKDAAPTKNVAQTTKTGMTLTIAILLFLELFICFGICYCTNQELYKISQKKEDQQSKFYSTLYALHK